MAKLVTKQPKTRNKFEERIYAQLKRKRCRVTYETAQIPYVIAGHYIPDFIIQTPSGKVYIETKGHFRPEAKRKMVAVKRQHPELDIRIVFYKYNKQYEKWAIRYGFKYAFEKVPLEWMEGF